MANNLKIFEIAGLPGSGKSYLTSKIKKQLSKNNKVLLYNNLVSHFIIEKYKILSLLYILPNKLKDKITFFIYKLLEYDCLLQKTFVDKHQDFYNFIKEYNDSRIINANYKKKVHHNFLITGEIYEIAENINCKGIVLISEGFIHRVSSLFVSEKEDYLDDEILKKYLTLIPKVDKLIFIDRDFKKCLEARIDQPTNRMTHLSEKEIIIFLNNNKSVFNKTLAILNKINIPFEILKNN